MSISFQPKVRSHKVKQA